MIYGFDFDGTIVKSFTSEPLPGVRELLHSLPPTARTFIATNQAGPVYRAVTGETKYPTVASVVESIGAALSLWALDWTPDLLLICCASGRAGEAWEHAEATVASGLNRQLASVLGRIDYQVLSGLSYRKPQPGMLTLAADLLGGLPMTYVGDMETDETAARRADARFVQAEDWHAGRVVLQ